jgi:nucleoside-diphosphate-sugar epimerase
MMSRVLVTGSTGFVGRALCETLAAAGIVVRAALRNEGPAPRGAVERAGVGDISSRTDWRAALAEADAVIHLAARVHVMHDGPANADAYMETNTRGTMRLAEDCVAAGVRRLVFLSSIKVNGEEGGHRPYTALDEPNPHDAYARSKWLAEQQLLELAARSSLQVVIVRPPLVHGPGVRANFLRLMRWVDRGLPLPFGWVRNKRSLVSLVNLCDFLLHVLRHPAASSRVWLTADDEALSTGELIRRIAAHMHRAPRLLPVPPLLLTAAGALTGRSAEIARLCGSLTLDTSPARTELDWSPPISADAGLARTVQWYLRQGRADAG